MPNPTFTPDDKAFLRCILDNPNDATAWLVYADWLDERSDLRGEYLRVEFALRRPDCPNRSRAEARLRDLTAAIDPDWVAILDRPPIENCRDVFAFRCPRTWEQLTPTRDVSVRFCESCEREVIYCRTLPIARQNAREGFCVAVSRAVLRTPGDLPLSDGVRSDDAFELLGALDDSGLFDPDD